MQETRDLQKVLNWLKRQELRNAHVISVLEGRHTPQFTALKRVLDSRSIDDVDSLKDRYRLFAHPADVPNLAAVVWDSEACERWHSPPRRIIEAVSSPRADLSLLAEPVLESFSDEFELAMVTNEPRTWEWIRINCSPLAWHLNVVYTVEKERYRPRKGPSVRLLTPRDERAVADFIERAGADEHGSTYGQFELAKRGLFYKCYGTFVRDKLAGFLTLFDRTSNVREVLWVRVDSQFRGQGIGSALVSFVTDGILSSGKIPMYLTTPSNIAAISMITNLGFSFAYERYTAQIAEIGLGK